MISFLVKRALWLLVTLWIVFTVTFFLMRFVPGGPFDQERKLEPEVKRNLEKRYQLDQPLHMQYLYNLARTAGFYLDSHGRPRWGLPDLGPSTTLRDFSVNEVLAQGFPISASLGILALIYASLLGLAAGVLSALRRQTWVDVSLMSVATLGIAVPNFLLAGVCLVLFVFTFPIFPVAGWGSFQQILLPAFCLGSPYAAYIARLTRTGMLDVINQDYIRTARAKGLRPGRVIIHHALKGAVLPVVSFLGPATAGILTGSLVLERIFFLPGMGSHFIEAALQRDYSLAMGAVLVYTVILYSMNTLVDLSYSLLDPRVKLS